MQRQYRWLTLAALVAMIGVGGWLSLAHAKVPDKKPAKKEAAKAQAQVAKSSPVTRQMIEALAKPIKRDVTVEPNFPLRLCLDYMGDLLDTPPILIDYPSFNRPNFQGSIDDAMVQRGIRIKAGNMLLSDLLQLVLDRLPVEVPRATFIVNERGITIVTWATLHNEIWGHAEPRPDEEKTLNKPKPPLGRPRQMLPLVYVEFRGKPLADALSELGEKTSYSVVLDLRRAREHAQLPVTALLVNVPIDTALRTVANQADLKVVRQDSVFIVTTAENAAILKAEADEMNKNDFAPLPGQVTQVPANGN